MKVERDFVVSASEQAVMERADARLRRAGFTPDPVEVGLYRRGTLIANLFSSDPSALQTSVWVLASPNVGGGTRVRTITKVNMAGQIATRLDMLFWKQELDALTTEIRTGAPQPRDDLLARRATIAGALLVGASFLLTLPIALLLLLVVGSPVVAFIAYALSIPLIFTIGVMAMRRDMPSLRSLSVAPPFDEDGSADPADRAALASMRRLAEEEAPEDLNQLALDDFDRRLSEALGVMPLDDEPLGASTRGSSTLGSSSRGSATLGSSTRGTKTLGVEPLDDETLGAEPFGGESWRAESLDDASTTEREVEQMAARAQEVGRQRKPR